MFTVYLSLAKLQHSNFQTLTDTNHECTSRCFKNMPLQEYAYIICAKEQRVPHNGIIVYTEFGEKIVQVSFEE